MTPGETALEVCDRWCLRRPLFPLSGQEAGTAHLDSCDLNESHDTRVGKHLEEPEVQLNPSRIFWHLFVNTLSINVTFDCSLRLNMPADHQGSKFRLTHVVRGEGLVLQEDLVSSCCRFVEGELRWKDDNMTDLQVGVSFLIGCVFLP